MPGGAASGRRTPGAGSGHRDRAHEGVHSPCAPARGRLPEPAYDRRDAGGDAYVRTDGLRSCPDLDFHPDPSITVKAYRLDLDCVGKAKRG